MLTILLQHTVFGIVSGSILLLATIGFSMVYTTKRFLCISHGELLTIGAYTAYAFHVLLGWNLLYSGIIAVAVTSLVGLAIARGLYEPMEGHGPLVLLFTSVGVTFCLHGILEFIAGPSIRSFRTRILPCIRVGGIPLITMNEIVIISIAMGSIVFLHVVLTRTRIGKAFRAMASNVDLAMARGIDTARISMFVWVYASAMAAVAGILLALVTSVNPDLGWTQILIILAAAILGGLGSIYGVMIGAILLGVVMDVGVIFFPSGYRAAIAFALMIIVLLVKPKGIFGGE